MKGQVLIKRPGQAFEVGELNGIDEMQQCVGGLIECVRIPNTKYMIVCNDSFLCDDSPFNIDLFGTVYCGNIFICAFGVVNDLGEHDLIGLTDEDVNEVLSMICSSYRNYYTRL